MRKKIFFILIIIALCTQSFSFGVNSHMFQPYSIKYTNLQDSNVIDGVPYIPQSEGYFCYYASIAMIFDYLGFNTSLDEILFLDGLGYTQYYIADQRLPEEACYSNIDFVFGLFGVELKRWSQNFNHSEYEYWEQYYSKIKENISNNVPIITAVDPFSLPSLRNQFKVSNHLWNVLFPPSMHIIVIVGYDENNQSICYNDPNAGFYGDNYFGDHAWINLSDFREAIEKCRLGRYIISTIEQQNEPYSKKERFEIAFKENIDKLQSNFSEFSGIYGITASKKMRDDFSTGKNNQSETINLYKKNGENGIRYTIISNMEILCSKLNNDQPNIFDIFMVGEEDPFESIADEKKHVADYLEQCTFYPDLCSNQSKLLREDAKNWYNLSNYYKIFLRKGMFILPSRGEFVMNNMYHIANKIVSIEESIILNILKK